MLKNLLFLRLPVLFLLLIISVIAILSINYQVNHVQLLFEIIINLTLIALTYIWSIKLLNGWWAILPPFLLTFSPFILNSYTNNAEIAAAFFYVLVVYLLINFIFKPNRLNLFLAGLGFGLAQLTGFPALILIPYFLILISVFYIASIKRDWLTTEPIARFKRFGIRGFKYFRSIIIIFVIGFFITLIGDAFFTLGKGCLDEGCGPNFFTHYYSYYSLQNLISNRNIQTSITTLIKIYWQFIILTASAFIYSLINIIKSFHASKFKGFFNYLGTSFPEFSMIIFITMYSLFMIFFTSGISAEKLMPILPMVYILTASGLKRLINNYL